MGDSPFGNYYGSPVLVYMEEPYKARQDGADPGQKFPFVEPAKGATGMWANFQPISSSQAYNNQNRAPYTEHFNLNIQRQFGDSVLLTLAYVGSRGRRLLYQADFNPGNPATCLAIRAALGPDAGCGEGGEDRIYNLGNGQFAYGTRPYSVTSGRLLSPGGGTLDFGMNPMEYTLGKSSYNALQVSLEKRVGALRVLGAYTWSKSMDNSSGFHDQVNPYNPAASRSLSAFDLAHNFVISYSYELPFAKLLHSNQGVMHKCLAGWDVSGITHFSTGLPVLLKQSRDLSLCGCGYGDAVDLPNYNGQPIAYSDPRTSGLAYFSGAPFSLSGEGAALGTIGNANRRFFHGPGLNNFDMALRKTTRINERVAVEFRAEFFNIFNHAQFYGPNGDFTSSAFGLVSRARDPRIGQVALKLTF
jgi:hypothetical protein